MEKDILQKTIQSTLKLAHAIEELPAVDKKKLSSAITLLQGYDSKLSSMDPGQLRLAEARLESITNSIFIEVKKHKSIDIDLRTLFSHSTKADQQEKILREFEEVAKEVKQKSSYKPLAAEASQKMDIADDINAVLKRLLRKEVEHLMAQYNVTDKPQTSKTHSELKEVMDGKIKNLLVRIEISGDLSDTLALGADLRRELQTLSTKLLRTEQKYMSLHDVKVTANIDTLEQAFENVQDTLYDLEQSIQSLQRKGETEDMKRKSAGMGDWGKHKSVSLKGLREAPVIQPDKIKASEQLDDILKALFHKEVEHFITQYNVSTTPQTGKGHAELSKILQGEIGDILQRIEKSKKLEDTTDLGKELREKLQKLSTTYLRTSQEYAPLWKVNFDDSVGAIKSSMESAQASFHKIEKDIKHLHQQGEAADIKRKREGFGDWGKHKSISLKELRDAPIIHPTPHDKISLGKPRSGHDHKHH